MARNTNRDRLIQTFLSRNRRKTPGGYRPQKQGTTAPYQPSKQGTSGAAFARYGANNPPGRITEDDPRWNASTMGNRTGYYKGQYYERGKKSRGARNYNKGNRPG